MKRFLSAILLTLLLLISSTVFAESICHVEILGKPITDDSKIIMIDDRSLISADTLFKALDIEYEINGNRITAKKDYITVVFFVGQNKIETNGEEKFIHTYTLSKDGNVFIPLRICAEEFNLMTCWDSSSCTASVYFKAVNFSCYPTQKYNFDINGNLSYFETTDGKWGKYSFDKNNNLTYYELSDGTWKKNEYDEKSNLIYSENYKNEWEKYEYDEADNVIYFEDSDGYWKKQHYDEFSNLIRKESSYGSVEIYDYKKDGSGTYCRYDFRGKIKYEYDEHKNNIYKEYSDGSWEKYEYNENGKNTYFEKSDGTWERYTYNENSNLIYKEDSKGNKFDYSAFTE